MNAASESFAYDAMGNRLSSVDGGQTTRYFVNSVNQYQSITSPTIPPSGARRHDAKGNLLHDGTRTYQWDSENRLLNVSRQDLRGRAGRVSYRYDALGRRVLRQNGRERTLYLYDGWNVIAEYRSVRRGAFTFHKRHLWGTDLSESAQGAGGVGGLLMSETIAENGVETEPQFFHYDGNGNVTALTDDRGNQTATYRYDAFGNSLVTQGEKAVENEYRFSTKPLDEVSGLYYYGYRYYDPVTGRWPSRDPIEENGGINLYGFVRNNSVNQWDYLGLKEDWCDECDEALKKSLSSARNKKSIAAIEELNREKGGSKCPLPEFSCVCCKENKDRGPNDPQRAGDYDPSTGQVRICCNNDHSGPEGVDAVVRHELVHAFDKCSGFDLNDCNDSACSEIRAYESQGVPRSLIVEYATRSVATNPKCKDKAREIVESQMERCLGTVNE